MIDFNASQDTEGGASQPGEPSSSSAAIPPLPPNPEHPEHSERQVDTQALAHQSYVPYTPPDTPTVEADRPSPLGATPYPYASSPNYSNYPNYPNYADYPLYPQPPARRRGVGPWIAVGGALLLVILIVTFAFGRAIGNDSAAHTGSSAIGTGRTAATVAVPPAAQDLQQTVVNVIHTVQPSVVEVKGNVQGGEVIGSGEIITDDGYIVTNDHVVQDGGSFTVTLSNGQTFPADVRGQSAQDDLAILKISAANLQAINFAPSSDVQVGQFVIAIGSPLGLDQSATFGIVSALNRTAGEGQDGPAAVLTGLIQTSAPINPGNSGGALVDLQGRLVGVPTLAAANSQTGGAADGIGFAIPSDRVKFVADQLIKNGKLVSSGQGFLGIQGQDVTPQLASAFNLPVQSGVQIGDFANDASGKSPAQAAGLQKGDIIVAVDGTTVNDSSDLVSALLNKSPGTQVKITVARGSGKQTVTVTLGERPTNAGG
jgi:S1-C subfamily serine protease